MAGSKGAAFAVVALLLALAQGATALNYVVGGPLAWSIPRPNDPNFYQDWAQSNFPYRTTDSLEFRWGQGDNLSLVSAADFTGCVGARPILSWTNELHLVLALTPYQNQRLYFISAVADHCARGQKFALDVYPAA